MSTPWLLMTYLLGGLFVQLLTAILSFWLLPADISSRFFMAGDGCGIWFNFMFKYCWFNRNTKVKLCCFDCMVPKIAYPFLMFLILTLFDIFQFRFRLDILVGLALAALDCRFFNGNMCNCCSLFNSLFNKCNLNQFESWVEGSPARIWPDGPYYCLEEETSRLQENSDDENDSVFKNVKKGVRLSDA